MRRAPDGSRVEARKAGTDADIWVVEAHGGCRHNLTNTPAEAEWSPAWGPDAVWIAYFSANEHGGNVYVMRPDGRARRTSPALTARLERVPDVVAGRKWLAYVTYGLSGNVDIARVKFDCSCRANLTRRPAEDTWPGCSRGGRRIAFVSDRDGNREPYTMRPDGSGVRRLTQTPDASENFRPGRSTGTSPSRSTAASRPRPSSGS